MGFLLTLYFCVAAHAGSGGAPAFVQVEADPEVYPLERLERPGVSVRPLRARRQPNGEGIPPREKREELFASVPGLVPLLEGWDELDRDQLLVRARVRRPAELRQLYPAFPAATLETLRSRAVSP